MASLNVTNFAAALKQMYPRDRIENLTFKNNVALAMIRKDPNVGGENWKVPLLYANIAGRSATFSIAQANKSPTKQVAFLMTAVDDYALASVKGKVWRASQGNNKAFLEAAASQLDSAFNALNRSMGIAMYRNGTGSIGQIDSTVTGTTLTLSQRRAIHGFSPGMKINFSGTDGGALRDGGETVTVSSINRTAGSMVVTPDLSNISGLTASDYIYPEGDGADGGSNIRMTGFQGWLPASISGGESHFGVDRSTDRVRLGGNYINGASYTIEEAIIRAATEISEQGGSADCAFMPYNLWEQLALELGAKREYTDTQEAGFHWRAIQMYSPDGPIRCYADRNCPPGELYVLTKDTWTLYSIGPCPSILDLDRVGAFLREATDDGYELRVGGYLQLGCHNPGANARVYNLPVGT